MNSLLITGSSGLIGSELVSYYAQAGWQIIGIDNNMRREFFGEQGDTSWNTLRLMEQYPNFKALSLDIRNREGIIDFFKTHRPEAVIHCAAQPSHDLAARIPFVDFEVNALGTLNLLEASRQTNPEVPFVYLSTNKVYGDAPNELALTEHETRYDFTNSDDYNGIRENFRIDQSKHSLFGASKLAADVMVQEYGRYFNMPTCCLRGGCLTGPNHSGVELHGFLSYLIRCNLEGKKYTIFGYKGKQVRDNIHSFDVATFTHHFLQAPRVAEVYNLGGGRENSISILEAFKLAEELSGKAQLYEYSDQARLGDHICYISDLSKIRSHYPKWQLTKDLRTTFTEIMAAWEQRLEH
jgi:CDP-paratose 2-epimerase